jgi:hypothetical protein
MSHRYFRATEEVYEDVRRTLDQAWGLPDSTGTVTCILPANVGIRDENGLMLLAVQDEFCGFTVAVDVLPQLLASGAIEEIQESAYRVVVSKWP